MLGGKNLICWIKISFLIDYFIIFIRAIIFNCGLYFINQLTNF